MHGSQTCHQSSQSKSLFVLTIHHKPVPEFVFSSLSPSISFFFFSYCSVRLLLFFFIQILRRLKKPKQQLNIDNNSSNGNYYEPKGEWGEQLATVTGTQWLTEWHDREQRGGTEIITHVKHFSDHPNLTENIVADSGIAVPPPSLPDNNDGNTPLGDSTLTRL